MKKEKNIFRLKRESLGLSREEASELLQTISPERLERIETEKFPIEPYEVIVMAKAYKEPSLCNYYCSHECPIGKKYVPEVKKENLSEIILHVLSSINSLKKEQEKLIDITVDGIIDDDELMEFIRIQNELEEISVTVENLQIWTEKMIADGKINMEKYNEICAAYQNKK